jgi:hypothetical protein
MFQDDWETINNAIRRAMAPPPMTPLPPFDIGGNADRTVADYAITYTPSDWTSAVIPGNLTTATGYIGEGDRRLVILALAELSLSRPGMEDAAREIAKALGGWEMFNDFRRTNADRVKVTHGDLRTGRLEMLADTDIEPVELPEPGGRIEKSVVQPDKPDDGWNSEGINTDIWDLL